MADFDNEVLSKIIEGVVRATSQTLASNAAQSSSENAIILERIDNLRKDFSEFKADSTATLLRQAAENKSDIASVKECLIGWDNMFRGSDGNIGYNERVRRVEEYIKNQKESKENFVNRLIFPVASYLIVGFVSGSIGALVTRLVHF